MYEDEPQDKVHDVLAGADVRRPPARAADHRPRRRGVLGAGAGHRGVARRAATCPATSWWPPPATSTTSGSWSWSSGAFGAAPGRVPAEPGVAERRRPPAALLRQGDRAVPPLPRRRPACRAATTAASRCACSTRSWAAPPRRGSSRRCARSAGLAYSVYSYSSHYADSGQVAVYVGTRPDNVRRGAGRDRRASCAGCIEDGVTAEELERARENVKGRTVLSMESTLARMNRLGSSVLDGRAAAHARRAAGRARRRDARRRERAWRGSCGGRSRCRPPAWGPTRAPSARALEAVSPPARGVTINVAVSGAAGRMGAGGLRARWRARRTWRSSGSRRPAARHAAGRRARRRRRGGGLLAARHRAAPTPAQCLEAGVHCVMGTTGADFVELEGVGTRQPVRGPELRHRRGADDGVRAAGGRAHARVRDRRAPPRPQARRPVGHRHAHGRADRAPPAATCTSRSTPCACPASWRTRRCSSAAQGQTLTIRHDSIARESFMPGVLLAVAGSASWTTRP